MKDWMKSVVKSGVLMFVVGSLLALAAPVIANIVGGESTLGPDVYKHAMGTPVLWTGLFFGAFGAIDAVCKPLINRVFGDREAPAQAVAVEQEKVKTQTIDLAPQPAQEQTKEWAQFVSAQSAAAPENLPLTK